VNHHRLDRAVARATGESLRTVRARGFGALEEHDAGPAWDGLTLVTDCPSCRRPVPYPGRAAGGSPALAECPVCDLYFEPRPDAVYDVTATRARAST
jgi:hypothetical protein